MIRDVVVVFGRARPRSIPPAMLTMKKGVHGFLFVCIQVGLFFTVTITVLRL